MWRMSKGGLPTKGKLQQRIIVVPMHCELCNHHSEDFSHLFLECQFVKNIVQQNNQKTFNKLYPWNKSTTDKKTILNNLKDNLGTQEMSKLAILWWCIWFFRNQIVFNNVKCEVKQVAEFITRQNNSWALAKKG